MWTSRKACLFLLYFFKPAKKLQVCVIEFFQKGGGELKSNELNLKVEFEDTFDIDNFSKSEQDIFFSSLLENLSKIYDKEQIKVEKCD